MKTITICLDESGTFEWPENTLRFIGGFIYEHGDELQNDSWENEKSKLDNKLRGLYEEMNMENYPRHLHNRTERTKWISERLNEYMSEPTSGYLPVVYLQDGKTPASEHDTKLVRDKDGSNLYEHMLNDLICNILFHTPRYLDGIHVILEIATRVAVITNDERNEMKNSFYREMGYKCKTAGNKNRWFLTDPQIIKASIDRYIRQNRISGVFIDIISTESTYYERDGISAPEDVAREQAGLYAADLCCDFYRNCLKENELAAPPQIQDAAIKLKEEFGALVYVYSSIDTTWGELMRAYRINDFLRFLHIYTDILNSPSICGDFYRHKSEEILGFINTLNDFTLKEIVERIRIEYYFKGKYEKTLHMLEILNEYYAEQDGEYYAESLYEIADLLMACWNHKGNLSKAAEYYQKCDNIRITHEIDEATFAKTTNRYISYWANNFRFEDSLKEIDKIINAVQKTSKPNRDLQYGKYLSTKGQMYSFLSKYDEAWNCFDEALSQIRDHANRLITLSYLLHMAISKNDKELYELYEEEYFEIKSEGRIDLLRKEFDVLKSPKHNNHRYALYVFVKAIHQFYLDIDGIDELIEEIISVNYSKVGYDITEHPFELIFKYLALLSKKIRNRSKRVLFRDLIVNFPTKDDTTIELINAMSLFELSKGTEKEEQYENTLNEKLELLHDDIKNTDRDKLFTYMYY